MTTATLTRPQRGMQIAMRTSRTWTASVVGLRIPSQSKPGVWYTVSLNGRCDCPDSIYRVNTPHGPRMCKHVAAFHIHTGRK